MKNNFDEELKKALTEYEKNIVENAEKNISNVKYKSTQNKWKKYLFAAAILLVLIPSTIVGSSIYYDNTGNELSEKNQLTENYDTLKSDSVYIDNYNIYSETMDFDNIFNKTENLIKKYNAKTENKDISNLKTKETGRYINYFIKVPTDDLDDFIKEFENLNINVISSNKSSYNITDDLNNAKENLNTVNLKLNRLNELLKEASSVTEITDIEGKIQEAESEKSSYEDILKDMENNIEYTGIYLDIKEVNKYSNTENVNEGFNKRIKKAFSNSKIVFIKTIQSTILGFITIIPFIVTIGLILLIVYLIYKKENKIH